MLEKNTFTNAAKEAARIMEQSTLKVYSIEKDGKYLTLWSGESPKHAIQLCARYYGISREKLTATLEP